MGQVGSISELATYFPRGSGFESKGSEPGEGSIYFLQDAVVTATIHIPKRESVVLFILKVLEA